MRLLLVVLLAVAVVPACALEGTTLTLGQAEELFRAGNSQYQKQEFDHARDTYMQLANARLRSPELYYNLGTACARLNHKAEAVLYLRRAHELKPHDPDILANLRRVAPANVVKSLSARNPFAWAVDRMSLREWMGLFLAAYFAACLIGAVYFAYARRAFVVRYLFIASAGIAAILAIFAARKYYDSHFVQYGVVATSGSSVRSGPAEKFAQVDILPEGEIIRRLAASEEGWAQVQLPDGRKGYLPEQAILLI
jgi:tetratricopeptide (TPR) repeat protein